MLSPFSCTNFSQEDDIEELLSPCSTPKRSSRKSKDSKNPYANRGLDKFSALLAELEGKKQRIYTQKGSEEISFVRFVYSGSNNWKPIVVKSKDRKLSTINDHQINQHRENIAKDKKTEGASPPAAVSHQIHRTKTQNSQSPQKENFNWSFSWSNLRRPSLYLPVMVIVILLFLAMFGRSFAILCTSIGWYLVPVIREKSSSSSSNSNSEKLKKKKKKKELGRRFSEKLTVKTDGSFSPNSVLSGPAEKSPLQQAHRKSF